MANAKACTQRHACSCVLHNCTCVHQQLLISTQPPFPPLHTPSRNNQPQQTCIYLRAAQLHVRPPAAVDQHTVPLCFPYTHVLVTIKRSKHASTCVLHNCTCVHQQLLISTQPPFPLLHTPSRDNQLQQTCIYLRAAQLHVRPPAAVDQHTVPLCFPYTHVLVTIKRSKRASTCVLHNCTCVHQQLLISTQPHCAYPTYTSL